MYTAPQAVPPTPIDLTVTPVQLAQRFAIDPIPNTFTPAPRVPGMMEALASDTKRRFDLAIAEGHVVTRRG